MCSFTVPLPKITMSPHGRLQSLVVGSSQIFQCSVSGVTAMQLNSVIFKWMGPSEVIITNNDRITIGPIHYSGGTYSSKIQFAYLMQGDEGRYTCHVTVPYANVSASVIIGILIGKS